MIDKFEDAKKFKASDKISPSPEGCPKDGVVKMQLPKATDKKLILHINGILLKQNPILRLPYQSSLKERAKSLRQARNYSEVLFWMQVAKGRFHKIDFDRQRVIGNYIVDFYIKRLGLVIEIDGSSHEHKVEYDRIRSAYLNSQGLRIYRIEVVDIFKNMDFVIMGLEDYIVREYGIY